MKNHLFYQCTGVTRTNCRTNDSWMYRTFLKPSVQITFMLLFAFAPLTIDAQTDQQAYSKDTLIEAARDIISSTNYCGLVTVDSDGQTQVRTMNPFPLGNEIVIWFATSRNSRKVSEIKNNPNVSVYYADHNNASGYVNINGTAEIIDDKNLLVKMKREYWNNIKGWQDIFVLIKITPKTMDVINYKKGINGNEGTNRSPVVVF